jgi:hypothetical protein
MLEYLYREGEEPCSVEPLKVRLDGIIVGAIRKVKSGYQYFPKGCREGGPVFKSVTAVQRSLRGEA